jgi:tetratricopeptide (TPR) repeat protein
MAGDTEASIRASERTLRLDPQSADRSIIYDNLSQAYWEEGRYEEGLQAARRLLADLPEYFLGYVYVAMNAVGLVIFPPKGCQSERDKTSYQAALASNTAGAS